MAEVPPERLTVSVVRAGSPRLGERSRARLKRHLRSTFGARVEPIAQLALLLLLAVGCWRVLAPFFPAILFALVIVSSTWPLYLRLRTVLGGRDVTASLMACAIAVLMALGPALLLMLGLADAARWALRLLDPSHGAPLAPLPDWVASLPAIGSSIAEAWQTLSDQPDRLRGLLGYVAAPARELALVSGRALGNAAMQIVLTTLVLYFLFRNGDRLATYLHRAAQRMGGSLAQELIDTARGAVSGVMFGAIGAGLAQAMLATLGFWIAGLPNPFLLGALTFVLSIVPVGPPLIWGGAALWLLQQGETGWALFMLIYGVLGISTIDNVLKPMLISRASHLPFVIALIGVVGGVLSFGVVGVFLGPTLLALLIAIAAHWIGRERRRPQAAAAAPAAVPAQE